MSGSATTVKIGKRIESGEKRGRRNGRIIYMHGT